MHSEHLLMTKSGLNAIAMGMTTRWKACKYSASPIPLSGHPMLTLLRFG
jgi:hypothetical protein